MKKVLCLGAVVLASLLLCGYKIDPIFIKYIGLEEKFRVFNVYSRMQAVSSGTTRDKVVALTFDDGPDPSCTPQVLSILSQYHIKATFFVVGRVACKYPQIVKEEVKMGHEVENHSFKHPNMLNLNYWEMKKEIGDTEVVLEKITGRRPEYFRPPKGLFNHEVVNAANEMGVKIVLWSVCVENHNCNTSEQMAKRVIKHAHPGMIVLAHDGKNREKTIEALPLVIKGLKARGYRFVTLKELLGS